MKTLAALVLLAAIASTASAVPRFLRARQQHHGVVVRGNPLGVDDQCPPNNEYWHAVPHPQDCGKFFICNWGVGVLQQCPGDLQFNPTLMVCDWPNNAGCTAGEEPPVEETVKPTEPASTAKPTTAKPTTAKPTTAAPESEETEEPVEPTTEAPESEEETEAPESEEETEAPVDEETEAPVDEETTQPAENEEPTTQADDESEEETTEPEEEVPVTEDPEEEEPAGPICPADGLHVVENPADCETFFLCNAGTAILVTCPEEQAFDRNFSTCTEAAAAGCSA